VGRQRTPISQFPVVGVSVGWIGGRSMIRESSSGRLRPRLFGIYYLYTCDNILNVETPTILRTLFNDSGDYGRTDKFGAFAISIHTLVTHDSLYIFRQTFKRRLPIASGGGGVGPSTLYHSLSQHHPQYIGNLFGTHSLH